MKKKTMTRRSFTTGILAASLGLMGSGKRPQTPFPYVDGLSFWPMKEEVFDQCGMSAFVLDVSSGRMTTDEKGRKRFKRTFEACDASIDRYRTHLEKTSPRLFLATEGRQVKEAWQKGQTAVFLQFQGCEAIGSDLDRIAYFYEKGLRILQITHHYDNAIGGGALEKETRGLTPLGFKAVERMNESKIIPDLSHASDQTCRDVLKTSTKPVIISHGSARALVNNARCTPDSILRAVADSGGVTGIFSLSFWLTEDETPTLEHMVRQIKHVANIGGIDSVGIAHDMAIDGDERLRTGELDNKSAAELMMPWWRTIAADEVLGFDRPPKHVMIPELNVPRRLFVIHEALKRSGFETTEIEKIMGGNWIRVLSESL